MPGSGPDPRAEGPQRPSLRQVVEQLRSARRCSSRPQHLWKPRNRNARRGRRGTEPGGTSWPWPRRATITCATVGPPGCSQTRWHIGCPAAAAFSRSEALTITRISRWPASCAAPRPAELTVRTPHHSCSAAALLGRASSAAGELSLAHELCCFWMAEFPRPCSTNCGNPGGGGAATEQPPENHLPNE